MIDTLLLDQIVTTNRTDAELDELRQEAMKEDSEYAIHDRILYYKDRIFVSKSSELREQLTQAIHEHLLVGHPGVLRTKTAIERHYYWPEIKKLVERCVQNCYVCRRAKALKDKYNGNLQPLPIPIQP